MSELNELLNQQKLTLAEYANKESNIPYTHLYWRIKSRIMNLNKGEPEIPSEAKRLEKESKEKQNYQEAGQAESAFDFGETK